MAGYSAVALRLVAELPGPAGDFFLVPGASERTPGILVSIGLARNSLSVGLLAEQSNLRSSGGSLRIEAADLFQSPCLVGDHLLHGTSEQLSRIDFVTVPDGPQ